ncbi:hypothetical protein MTR67_051967 [Solanum verrucosum]|uniref:Tf2-1-like SH3-like domain-containing protein n=1 Tax=Solanum verrucosum TaxID=315347 RepID=A0AAF0V5D3_SOLVR|nr:hypothetical protein MTR67_051967 [Solanum verrucosum]
MRLVWDSFGFPIRRSRLGPRLGSRHQSRQKRYTDHKVRDMLFHSSEKVLLMLSPMKGVMRFGKKGKLSPRYIGPFEILDGVGKVADRLILPPNLSRVHTLFHVSMLKIYHGDEITSSNGTQLC